MKRHWIEYGDDWLIGPMTYWVHVEHDGQPGDGAARLDPPKPRPVPGRGYARFHVDVEGFTFYFASLAEVRACIGILGQRVLPTTLRMTADRATSGVGSGPNQHWLSRLPARLLPWRRRQKAVAYLRRSLGDFEVAVDANR